jgi:hypothetical protein
MWCVAIILNGNGQDQNHKPTIGSEERGKKEKYKVTPKQSVLVLAQLALLIKNDWIVQSRLACSDGRHKDL